MSTTTPVTKHTIIYSILMFKLLPVLLILGFLPFSVLGQDHLDLPEVDLAIISQVNQGNSYITAPTDIGNIEPLWFEANLIPNFYLRENKSARLMGVLTPQIIIRMYQEESFPVRTPSYMPQLTLYYFLKKRPNLQTLSLYGRIGHHSNGQEEAFYLEDGTINLESGSFSTNYLELGFIRTNINSYLNAYQFFKTSLEFHPKKMVDKPLHGRYSRFRWNNAFSVFRLPADEASNTTKRPVLSLKGETTWMFGDYDNLSTFSPERLNFGLTFYYHPNFLEEIGFFVRYYHGSDYYNIHFDHRLDVLRFGIMTEKLSF